jgi:hypothetical protein
MLLLATENDEDEIVDLLGSNHHNNHGVSSNEKLHLLPSSHQPTYSSINGHSQLPPSGTTSKMSSAAVSKPPIIQQSAGKATSSTNNKQGKTSKLFSTHDQLMQQQYASNTEGNGAVYNNFFKVGGNDKRQGTHGMDVKE